MVRRSGGQLVVPSGGQVVGSGSDVAVRWAGWGRSGGQAVRKLGRYGAVRWTGCRAVWWTRGGQVAGRSGGSVLGAVDK